MSDPKPKDPSPPPEGTALFTGPLTSKPWSITREWYHAALAKILDEERKR